MKETNLENENKELSAGMKSMQNSANGTKEIATQRPQSKTPGVYVGFPILVSEQQFETVKQEHLKSMDLLNSSASALLGAMESVVPPKDSGRIVGEYTGQNMRQMAKSICDLIRVKTEVVRSMHTIARDGY